jgi:hypothetical protein
MTHEQLCAAFFQWHWNEFPDERQMLYGVNNNSANRIEGNRNKAKGVVPGVLDFCYILPCYNTCAYLDAKVGNDVLSKEQLSFIEKCSKRGIQCFTFSSLEEGKKIINTLRNGG